MARREAFWAVILLAGVAWLRSRQQRAAPEPAAPSTNDGHPRLVVTGRLNEHAATHWREFSVIVASGSIGIALVAGGVLASIEADPGSRILLTAMLLASIVAFALAYFSIQVGTLVLFGQLTIWEVLLAFTIAGSQVAMPLWLLHVARLAGSNGGVDRVWPSAGHWFAFFAIFALAAAVANKYEAARRAQAHLSANEDFEKFQRLDRRGAAGSAAVALVVWVGVLLEGVGWRAGVGLALLALAVLTRALFQQSRAATVLADATTA